VTAPTDAPPRLHRDGATWLLYLQLSLFAFFLYGFAPSVTLLRDEEHTSDAIAGLHGTVYAAGVVVFGTVAARVIRALGGRDRALWVFLSALCAFIGVYVSSTELAVTLTGVFLAGMASAGLTTAAGAALIARHGAAGPTAVTEANGAAAGAGLLSPLAIGGAVGLGWGWRPALLLVVALTALLFVLRRRLTRGVAPVRDGAPTAADIATADVVAAAGPDGPAGRGLGRQFWYGWTMVMFTVGVEFSMTVWAAQLLRDRSGVGAAVAATAVTAIVAGMCVGRLLGSRLTGRFGVDRLLIAAYALSAAGFAVFWLADTAVVAFAGLAVCGLGMALHYPLGMARAVGSAGPAHADRASAVMSLGTGIAAGLAPFALGFLSDIAPTRYAFLLVPALLLGAATTLGFARASAAHAPRAGAGDRPVTPTDSRSPAAV
jgi:MFS family permease